MDAGVFNHTLLAVLLCCFASSATYIINDMHGIRRGRRPLNKSTACPLAARAVMVSASLIRLACLCRVLRWCRLVAPKVVLVIAACMLLNLAPTNAANVLLA
jgi:4-hydroxybenzoate polyprenyltransferase